MSFAIIKPLVTEKNTILAESNTYVFEVKKSANKTQIKNEIEKNFQVKVKNVRTVNCRSDFKQTRFGLSKPSKWKKAFVQLKEGSKLGIFEGAN